MLQILILFLGLGVFASAKVDFVGYVKRNHERIAKSRPGNEKVAFKEKARSIASVPPKEEPKTNSVLTPPPAGSQAPNSAVPTNPVTGESENTDSATMGPGR